MRLSNIANVVDIEHDQGFLVEIGITTVDLSARQILTTYSLPRKTYDRELSKEFKDLTGWTEKKLLRQGLTYDEIGRRLKKLGFVGRLLISDTGDEIDFLERKLMTEYSSNRLNVSVLFKLITGLDNNLGLDQMLKEFGLVFEGNKHLGADDSRNIARLFLRMAEIIDFSDEFTVR